MAQTIAQWIRGKLWHQPGAQEQAIYNPLSLIVGRHVALDTPDFSGLDFQVESIQQYVNTLGGEAFRFAAYDLVARPLNQVPVRVQIRAEAVADSRPGNPAPLNVLLLSLHEDVGRKQFAETNGVDLYQIVQLDQTGVFQIRDDQTDALQAEFFRPPGVLSSLHPRVTVLKDLNADGVVAAEKLRTRDLEYWDYSRQTTDAAGNSISEFLIVELEDNAWWKIWRGPAVDAGIVQDF